MPTVARGSASYLNVTLQSLLCQIMTVRDPALFMCIGVYEPWPPGARFSGDPTPFELAERALADRPAEVRQRVIFVRERSRPTDAAVANAASATISKVEKTKRQTADVAHMLLALAPRTRGHLILMEDDWLLCEGGLRAIQYLLAKAQLYQPDFAALRFSYGLNGILMHGRDLPPFANFLLNPASEPDNNLPDAPVDHLTYRWLRGKYSGGRRYFGARRIMAFRHTLFWHVGDASAVGNSKTRHKPKCYGLTKEWLFDKEAFHVSDCPDDDIWPCVGRPVADSDASAELQRLGVRSTSAVSTVAAARGAPRPR